MKQKNIEKEAKSPDVFFMLSDRVLHWVEEKKYWFAGAIAILLVGGLGFVGFEQYNKSVETSALKALYPIENEIRKIQQDLAKKTETKTSDAKAIAKPTSGLPEPLVPLTERYEKAIRSHLSSKASAVAGIQLASLYSDYEQWQKAADILSAVAPYLKAGETLMALVKMQLGSVYFSLGNWDRALASFSQVFDEKAYDFVRGQALLKMGLVYEKQGAANKARETFERVKSEFPQAEVAETARKYLRSLNVQVEPTSAKR